MTAMTINRRQLPVIDRAAIRLGNMLVAWGRQRADRMRELEQVDVVRRDYAERVRTASAVVQQRLLP